MSFPTSEALAPFSEAANNVATVRLAFLIFLLHWGCVTDSSLTSHRVELKRMWKETFVTWCKVLSQHSPECLRKALQNLNSISLRSDLNSKQGPSKRKSDPLPVQPAYCILLPDTSKGNAIFSSKILLLTYQTTRCQSRTQRESALPWKPHIFCRHICSFSQLLQKILVYQSLQFCSNISDEKAHLRGLFCVSWHRA